MTRCFSITLLLLLQLCHHGNSCQDGCQCFTPSKVFCSDEHLMIIPQNLSSEVKELVITMTKITYVDADTFPPNSSLVKLVLLNNLLRSISEDAFNNLQVLEELEVSGNPYLKKVATETFSGLVSLTKLLLNHNRISALQDGLFDSLRKMQTLQLKNNNITYLPTKLFHCLGQLRILDLSQNSVSMVERNLFDGLTALKKLVLNYNLIGALHPDTFRGLTHLEQLGLQGNRITKLHQDLFSSLKHLKKLNLRNNLIVTITPGTFPPSLTELNLENNNLIQLSTEAFKDLLFLTHLLLSRNQLSALPEDVFRNLTSLEYLDLSENWISILPVTSFSGLDKLMVVHLERNNISHVEAKLFEDQPMMEQLYLSDNNLVNIPDGFFSHFLFLNAAHLHGNPWRCDCKLLAFHEWLRDAALLPSVLAKVYCVEPVFLRGQVVASLNPDQLVCPDNLTAIVEPVIFKGLPNRQPQVQRCTLQESDGRFSIRCTLLDCPRVKMEIQYIDRNGKMLTTVDEREWSESAQCVNATVTLTF